MGRLDYGVRYQVGRRGCVALLVHRSSRLERHLHGSPALQNPPTDVRDEGNSPRSEPHDRRRYSSCTRRQHECLRKSAQASDKRPRGNRPRHTFEVSTLADCSALATATATARITDRINMQMMRCQSHRKSYIVSV